MGLVRANWHLDMGTPVNTSDPFELAQQQPDPSVRLRELILLEADLDHVGITCPLKDRDWTHPSCSTCPERGDKNRAQLCRVGMEQEKVLASV